jgi:hypothetical protein
MCSIFRRAGAVYEVWFNTNTGNKPQKTSSIVCANVNITTKETSTDCSVGDAVMAIWVGDDSWYGATIAEVHSDGFVVNWNDGSTADRKVSRQQVKKNGALCSQTTTTTGGATIAKTTTTTGGAIIANQTNVNITTKVTATNCSVGDAVMALCVGDDSWYGATIAEVSSDGFVVNWNDGSTADRKVSRQQVKKNGALCSQTPTTTMGTTTTT